MREFHQGVKVARHSSIFGSTPRELRQLHKHAAAGQVAARTARPRLVAATPQGLQVLTLQQFLAAGRAPETDEVSVELTAPQDASRQTASERFDTLLRDAGYARVTRHGGR
jgi:hypothetical protein